jgi:pheromone shutdown protein TraB
MSDVERHRPQASRSRGRTLARAIQIRITGAILYCSVVDWCAYELPTSLPFVIPGAVLGGGILRVAKGHPWLGLAVFTIIVVAVPALLWPAMATGTFANLTDGL